MRNVGDLIVCPEEPCWCQVQPELLLMVNRWFKIVPDNNGCVAPLGGERKIVLAVDPHAS